MGNQESHQPSGQQETGHDKSANSQPMWQQNSSCGLTSWERFYEKTWKLIIRPPRCTYSRQLLGPESLRVLLPGAQPGTKVPGQSYKRQDLELRNARGQILQCSHFVPNTRLRKPLPCVIFCHGSSSCRVEAFKVMPVLLQYDLTLFCFDFAGCGLSEGDFVSLGHHEEADIGTVVNYLQSTGLVSSIGLWGKSMGAVASILRTANDPRIDACVLDSAFSDFPKLVSEQLQRSNLCWAPSALVAVCLDVVSHEVQVRAGFDPRTLVPVDKAPQCNCPALFCAAEQDVLVPTHHARALQEAWGGPSELLIIHGTHNGERPSVFLQKAARFLREVLHDAASTKCEKFCATVSKPLHEQGFAWGSRQPSPGRSANGQRRLQTAVRTVRASGQKSTPGPRRRVSADARRLSEHLLPCAGDEPCPELEVDCDLSWIQGEGL